MDAKAKSPVSLLVALILLFSSLAVSGFYLLKKERAKTQDLQEKLEDLNTRQRIAETKLQESTKTISLLEARLQEAKSQIDNLSQELQQEKKAKEQSQLQAEQIRQDLEQQKSLRSNLETKFNQAQEEVKKIQAQLIELESKKSELEAKIKDLEAKEQKVELGEIVVSPEPEAATVVETEEKAEEKTGSASQLEGKVLVINKDYNFVVINLGGKDGVGTGNVFSVYRNNKYLGDIKVEKIHDSMAAAGFVTKDLKGVINEGDKVLGKTR